MAGKTTKKAAAKKTAKRSAQVVKKAAAMRVAAKPTLLAGGNPQIAKADGNAPVQAYIAAWRVRPELAGRSSRRYRGRLGALVGRV